STAPTDPPDPPDLPELYQPGVGLHELAFLTADRGDDAVAGCAYRELHLHRLEDEQRIAFLHGVSRPDVDLDDRRGHRRCQGAACRGTRAMPRRSRLTFRRGDRCSTPRITVASTIRNRSAATRDRRLATDERRRLPEAAPFAFEEVRIDAARAEGMRVEDVD